MGPVALPSLKVLPQLEVLGKASHRISRQLTLQRKTREDFAKRSEPYPLLSSQKNTSTDGISKQNSKTGGFFSSAFKENRASKTPTDLNTSPSLQLFCNYNHTPVPKPLNI